MPINNFSIGTAVIFFSEFKDFNEFEYFIYKEPTFKLSLIPIK